MKSIDSLSSSGELEAAVKHALMSMLANGEINLGQSVSSASNDVETIIVPSNILVSSDNGRKSEVDDELQSKTDNSENVRAKFLVKKVKPSLP